MSTDEFILAGSISRFYVFSSSFFSVCFRRAFDPCASWLRVQRLKDKLYNTRDGYDIDDININIFAPHVSMPAKSWAEQFLQHLINLLIDVIFIEQKKTSKSSLPSLFGLVAPTIE